MKIRWNKTKLYFESEREKRAANEERKDSHYDRAESNRKRSAHVQIFNVAPGGTSTYVKRARTVSQTAADHFPTAIEQLIRQPSTWDSLSDSVARECVCRSLFLPVETDPDDMVNERTQHDGADNEQNAKFLSRNDATYVATAVAPKKNVDDYAPVDGGVRAWSIMVGSFFCNGILFGVINCHGVLYNQLFETLEKEGVPNASGKAALSGSLAMGMTFFMSPLSGILTDCVGIRKTTFIGGLIASVGMFLSSFCTHNITAFCFTYGIMYGLGGSLAYTPCLAVLGHYFKRYLGIVNGVASSGSSVFTIVMPYVMDALLQKFGLIWTLRALALIAGLIMAVAVLFKPVKIMPSLKKVQFRDLFNLSVLTNSKYIIWITVIGLCLFGYFIPYVYVISFVKKEFPKGVDKNLPVLCIGIMSGISRLVFGYIVDRTNVNKILLQQLSFLVLGVLTMLLPLSAGNFPLLLTICLGMGITDGCFISLLGPVAFELCGRDGGTQAIGFLLGVCSLPLTIGPYVAGLLYDHQRSFTLPFLLAGINPTIASFGMLGIRCVGKRDRSERPRADSSVQEPLSPSVTDLQQRKSEDQT